MSVFRNLMIDLQEICYSINVNFEETKKELEFLIGEEEIIAYLFGIVMAPENPNTLFDLLMIGQIHLFSFDKEKTELIISQDKLDEYTACSINKQDNKIKLEIRQASSMYQYYINNHKNKEAVVMNFFKKLQDSL